MVRIVRLRQPLPTVCHRIQGFGCCAPLRVPSRSSCRFFASAGVNNNKPRVSLQKLGDFPYGSREYRLVVNRLPSTGDDSSSSMSNSNSTTEHDPNKTAIASLRAHRNILFGAQLLTKSTDNKSLSQLCAPLLDVAVADAGMEGEQPQAMATLHGLCDWVMECLDNDDDGNEHDNKSKALQKIKNEYQDDLLAYHAIKAMATGIPREGHSVVGQGTFRDGEQGWDALAREFIELKKAEEVELYVNHGATLVTIEHLADTKPDYLRSAGGAMARLFFL